MAHAAYEAGKRAARSGNPGGNPFHKGTKNYTRWNNGYNKEHSRQLKALGRR
jgi:hypothetical protein